MRRNFGIFWVLSISVILSSCLGTRHLKNDQLLLYKQKIKGNEKVSDEELEEFYKQKSNKKIPLIPFAPYVWIYHIGFNNYHPEKIERKIEKLRVKYDKRIEKNSEKPKKVEKLEEKKARKIEKKQLALQEGSWLMRWGEPLSIYNEDNIAQTRSQMDTYLKTKGYFNSEVKYLLKKRGKKVLVRYVIDEGQPHLFDTFFVSSENENILNIIRNNVEDSHIEEGENYSQDILSQERERVTTLLQNNGYFSFKKQYIDYRIDTLNEGKKAKVEMVVRKPKFGEHKVFTIDSVNFITDAGISQSASRNSKIYQGVKYQFYESQFSKKILDQRLFLYPGEHYSRSNTLLTQRQLANLDNFKFININYDTTGGYFMANIFTSSLPKYQMTNELGVSVTEGFPGPFYRFSLKNRNVFKGLENMEFSGYYGFEGVLSFTGSDRNIYSSTEAGAKLSLYFPQFIFPGFNKMKKKSGRYNPQTILRNGFDFTDRPEYRRTGFNSSWVYTWRKFEKRIYYNYTFAEIGVINSDLNPTFKEFLDNLAEEQGNNLRNAFNPSFISNTQFLVTYNFDPVDDFNNRASYLRVFGELGGLMYNFYNPEILSDSLEYYQYLKGSGEYIRHLPVSENGVVATRLKVGAAYPYGINKEVLPYEKYYFSGGSNSIRAWRPRRLGPGSYNHNLNSDRVGDDDFNPYSYDNKIEQPGEILIEANIEYRSKLVGFLDWAFFVDVGNIWMFNEDLARPGANFELNRFYKEFGVGSGLGLRLNFSFLIIRFDYGVKIYDPIRPEGERFIGDEYDFFKFRGEPDQTLWNFAIGYPF